MQPPAGWIADDAEPTRSESALAAHGQLDTGGAGLPVAEPSVAYAALEVTVGDGLKFGCGFLAALVLLMLVAFVLAAAIVVLSRVAGFDLPPWT